MSSRPPQPTTEQHVESALRRATQSIRESIFDVRGELRAQRAQQMSHDGQVYLGEYLHLDSIPWAPEPDGAEHSEWLARLVDYMAQLPGELGGVVGGPISQHDQKVLYACAMLYAVGKGSLGLQGPPLGGAGYEQRSAAYAERFFRGGGGSGTYWGKDKVREEVSWLLFKHMDAREISVDKRLQVFADARAYESVRVKPNTAEGLAYIREHYKPDACYLGWSKSRDNFRAWM